VKRAKTRGQSLSNQLASSAGTSSPSTSNLVQTELATTDVLKLFIADIQDAQVLFNTEREIYPAAARIEVELLYALQSAIQADNSSAQGDIAAFKNHLREAINHLELSDVLISHGNVANPIDVASFVVRQHYVDFLDREPDEAGGGFWANQITSCGLDAQCSEAKRINTSAAFFLSIEFRETGYLVHRLYKASFGRVPQLGEFMPDNAAIGHGVIVGSTDWQARLAANKDQFLQVWVERADFTARYAGLTNQQYVDTLIANLDVTINSAERRSLVQALGSGSTRASVLARLADSESFSRNEFNRAFVLMQYFGYLRRDPDSDGFNFWLNKLNQFDGDYQRADMVKAFLASQEYRNRFRL
jgi:Domain of unknown function (DUF4214)